MQFYNSGILSIRHECGRLVASFTAHGRRDARQQRTDDATASGSGAHTADDAARNACECPWSTIVLSLA